MPLDRIDVRQARKIMENDRGAVYLDVRTEAEFAEGHPEGAINVPIGTPNPMMQRMDFNPDFLDVVRASVPESAAVIVGCRAGPRAEMAARLLSQSGYHRVSWVLGGFHGMSDAMGNVMARGWLELGFPVSREIGEGTGYASLRMKAGKVRE